MPALANVFAAAQQDDTRDIREIIEQSELLDDATKEELLLILEDGVSAEKEQELRFMIMAAEQKKMDIDQKFKDSIDAVSDEFESELKGFTAKKRREWNTKVEGVSREEEEMELKEMEAVFDDIDSNE